MKLAAMKIRTGSIDLPQDAPRPDIEVELEDGEQPIAYDLFMLPREKGAEQVVWIWKLTSYVPVVSG